MDILLNLNQARKVMGVSYGKALMLAKSGALPFRKLGSTWTIPRSVLYRELGLEAPKEEEARCA